MTNQKVYFTTGAGRGIGSDLVTTALEAGYCIVATARDAAAITAAVGEHERLLPLTMDVTNPTAIDRAVRKALDRFGSIDVLINNAGRFYTGFFETMSPEQVRGQMEVNFFGTLNVTRAILPIMRSQRRGHVVTVSALIGVVGYSFMSIFGASKFALEGWMESIAPEVAPFGITTCIIEPGAFRTKPGKDALRSVFPEIVIQDYEEATKECISSIKGFYGNEPGHRNKLASAFLSIVDMENPPRRWVAGKDAVEGIVAKGHQLISGAKAFSQSTELDHDD